MSAIDDCSYLQLSPCRQATRAAESVSSPGGPRAITSCISYGFTAAIQLDRCLQGPLPNSQALIGKHWISDAVLNKDNCGGSTGIRAHHYTLCWRVRDLCNRLWGPFHCLLHVDKPLYCACFPFVTSPLHLLTSLSVEWKQNRMTRYSPGTTGGTSRSTRSWFFMKGQSSIGLQLQRFCCSVPWPHVWRKLFCLRHVGWRRNLSCKQFLFVGSKLRESTLEAKTSGTLGKTLQGTCLCSWTHALVPSEAS